MASHISIFTMQGIHESWVWWLTLFCVDITSCFYSIMLFVYIPLIVLLSTSLFAKSYDVACYILHCSLFMILPNPSALIILCINPSFKARALKSLNAADFDPTGLLWQFLTSKVPVIFKPSGALDLILPVYIIKWCIRHHWPEFGLLVYRTILFCRSQTATEHIFTKECNCRPALDLNSWLTFHPPTSTNTPTLLGLPKSRAIHLLMLILPTLYFIRECKIKGWALWERDALRQELKIRRFCQHSFFGKSCTIHYSLSL